MTTPPSAPTLHIVLQALKADFGLTDSQLAALPRLDEVDISHQNDCHLIEHTQPTALNYHPYKLYIGEHFNEPWHVYLHRSGGRKQYKLEITSVNLKENSHHEPYGEEYYGSVTNLAYPFNTFLGTARFAAIVKWYFVVAYRAGVFDADPGFSLTNSWRVNLQGACDELITAPGREAKRKQKEVQKRIAEARRRESLDAKEQVAARQGENLRMTKARSKADELARHGSTRKKPAPTMDTDCDDITQERQPTTSARRKSQNPRASSQNDQATRLSRTEPPVAFDDAVRSDGRMSRGLSSSYLEDAQSSRCSAGERNSSPPRKQPPVRHGSGNSNVTSNSLNESQAGTRREAGGLTKRKRRLAKEGLIPTDRQSAQKVRIETTTGNNRLEALEGFTDNVDDNNDSAEAWIREVERLSTIEKDKITDEEDEGAAESMRRARREVEWMALYRRKVGIFEQMRNLEDEMSVEEKLDVFDKVKYA